MKIRCIVIDDELPAIEQMQVYINRVPFMELLHCFDNAIEPITFLKHNTVDLIFLDIEMEGFNGIQLLKSLKNKPKVILTTAYDVYALDAFNLNVTDYLLKPISFERFIQSLDKLFDTFQAGMHSSDHEPQYKRDYFFVKSEFRIQRVNFDDILFIEGMKEYLRIHTKTEKIMTLLSFKTMETLLPSENFYRVHKSYIIPINKIDTIERNRIFIQKNIIPISPTYKEGFFVFLNKAEN